MHFLSPSNVLTFVGITFALIPQVFSQSATTTPAATTSATAVVNVYSTDYTRETDSPQNRCGDTTGPDFVTDTSATSVSLSDCEELYTRYKADDAYWTIQGTVISDTVLTLTSEGGCVFQVRVDNTTAVYVGNTDVYDLVNSVLGSASGFSQASGMMPCDDSYGDQTEVEWWISSSSTATPEDK